VAVAAIASGVSACGSEPRQDADEPSGDFPTEVTAAQFATDQRLAETSDLTLDVKNAGDETIPDLAVTIYTGDQKAGGPFQVRSDQPGLADPNRPVWILENEFPKCVTDAGYKLQPNSDARCVSPLEAQTKGGLDKAQSAGAEAAQTDTFSFGPLEPNETREIVWRVTPVQPGTYTVHYRVAAGLLGKAVAVTGDGSIPEGEFVVVITDVPPQTRVDNSGRVVPIHKGDIIGQAGSQEQKSELGGGTSTSP
jgi:hypothetical protein